MDKRIIFLLILVFIMCGTIFAEDGDQPLKLTIRIDKEVYSAGDEIKVTYTIENVSNEAISFYLSEYGLDDDSYPNYPQTELRISSGSFYDEYFSAASFGIPVPLLKTLQPREKWVKEEAFATIGFGKLSSKYIEGGRKNKDKLDRELLYIDFGLKFWQLKNGYGSYGVFSKFCSRESENYSGCLVWIKGPDGRDYCDPSAVLPDNFWRGCIKSNVVEIKIVE